MFDTEFSCSLSDEKTIFIYKKKKDFSSHFMSNEKEQE